MKNQKQFTIFQLISFLGMAIFFAWQTFTAGQAGYYLGAGILALLTALTLWALTDVRHGLRPLTHFERFETWYFGRAILVFVGGGSVLPLLAYLEVQVSASVGMTLILSWLGLSIYTVRHIRGRWESVGGYKQRMNYVEPPSPSKPTKK